MDETSAPSLDLTPCEAQAGGQEPYAIVDIGSNSIRIVVYERLARAPLPRFNEKSLCRLGEGLARTGAIAPENFRRTVEALRRFRAIADAMGVTRIDATATEAMRRATNGEALRQAIAEASGLTVRILSGAEEARHAALGVVSGFFRPAGLVGDMGGGSLEVAEVLEDRVGARWVSLPLGALPVEALMEEGAEAAKRAIDAQLAQSLPPALTQPVFYPVGGGWRALAKAHMAAIGAPVPVVHGHTVETAELRAFAKAVWRQGGKGKGNGKGGDRLAAALAAVPARRLRSLPAAALLLDRSLKRLAPERVVFSALGLREGWLYAQLPEAERARDPLVEGARLIGLPPARVPGFAQALLRWTEGLFLGESPDETRLRVAACALSDIAWRDHQDLRAAETFRRVLLFPFIGITHPERAFLAAALHARYGGRADDPVLAPALALLSKPRHRRAVVLGRALTLAYRLSAGVPAVLAGARLSIGTDRLTLAVDRAARIPDSDAVASRLNALAAAIGVKRAETVEVPGDGAA